MLVVFAVSDKRNGPPPAGLVPLVIFIFILGVGTAFGMQTGEWIAVCALLRELTWMQGYAINPARDLGPRIMTAMVGYGREGLSQSLLLFESMLRRSNIVFNFRDQYWLWCPILGPIAGGLVGAFVYDALIFLGDESILNRP